MAEVTIRMIDRGAAGREIHIDLASDPDALPHEHEQDHKRVVEALMGQGILKGSDKIVVTRGGRANGEQKAQPQEAPAARQAQNA